MPARVCLSGSLKLQLLTLSRRNLLVSSVKEGFITKEFQPDGDKPPCSLHWDYCSFVAVG